MKKRSLDSHFVVGAVVTALWLGIMVALVIAAAHDKWGLSLPGKLNEWGDYSAGFFAPLAFLWLVICYRLQAQELRQSSDALKLQARELASSVEQQTQMVEVSRQQLQNSVNALNAERVHRLKEQRELAERSKPFFELEFDSWDGFEAYRLSLRNVGGPAVHVWIDFLDQGYDDQRKKFGALASVETKSLVFSFSEPRDQGSRTARLGVYFSDLSGFERQQVFMLVESRDHASISINELAPSPEADRWHYDNAPDFDDDDPQEESPQHPNHQ
jgi:hypothetical protein